VLVKPTPRPTLHIGTVVQEIKAEGWDRRYTPRVVAFLHTTQNEKLRLKTDADAVPVFRATTSRSYLILHKMNIGLFL
jgi:hypothetical protein